MNIIKKITAMAVCGALMFSFAACGTDEKADSDASTEKETLTIAYQGGLGYAPIHVMQAKNYIEEAYEGDVTVEFKQLDSGASINEGIIGGNIDIGCMGIAPAVSGVAGGVPYKIMSNLSSSQNGLMTADADIKSIKDIKTEDKIALVNTGSIQHIILAMACKNVLGDAHALDNNISPMAHAEGMGALESGTVKLHLTASPFLNQERENSKYHEIPEVEQAWPTGNSFLVAVASTELHDNNPDLYNAVQTALAKAMDLLKNDKDGAADIEKDVLSLDKETVLNYLSYEGTDFFAELKGAKTMADFMFEAEFISKEVSIEDLKYDDCQGE